MREEGIGELIREAGEGSSEKLLAKGETRATPDPSEGGDLSENTWGSCGYLRDGGQDHGRAPRTVGLVLASEASPGIPERCLSERGTAPGALSAEHPRDKPGGAVGRRGCCSPSDVEGCKHEVLNWPTFNPAGWRWQMGHRFLSRVCELVTLPCARGRSRGLAARGTDSPLQRATSVEGGQASEQERSLAEPLKRVGDGDVPMGREHSPGRQGALSESAEDKLLGVTEEVVPSVRPLGTAQGEELEMGERAVPALLGPVWFETVTHEEEQGGL